jgi:hypothetical protein
MKAAVDDRHDVVDHHEAWAAQRSFRPNGMNVSAVEGDTLGDGAGAAYVTVQVALTPGPVALWLLHTMCGLRVLSHTNGRARAAARMC